MLSLRKPDFIPKFVHNNLINNLISIIPANWNSIYTYKNFITFDSFNFIN